MKRKIFLLMVLTLVMIFAAFGQVHNIEPVPGKTMVFKGAVKAGEGNEQLYIFESQPDQLLTVKISSVNDNAVFSVNEQYRVEHSPLEIEGQSIENQKEEWSGKLPQTESNRLYSVAVTSTQGTANFTLEITLGGKTVESVDHPETEMDSLDPQTVKDYYLLMPKKYNDWTRAEREEALESTETLVDLKHGYIHKDIGTLGESFEARIFKLPGGGYIFAYNEDGDPSVQVLTKLFLLKYENGQWKDLTRKLLPVVVNRTYHYDLPQIGTTIKVTSATGTKIYNLLWRNGKFVKG